MNCLPGQIFVIIEKESGVYLFPDLNTLGFNQSPHWDKTCGLGSKPPLNNWSVKALLRPCLCMRHVERDASTNSNQNHVAYPKNYTIDWYYPRLTQHLQ